MSIYITVKYLSNFILIIVTVRSMKLKPPLELSDVFLQYHMNLHNDTYDVWLINWYEMCYSPHTSFI